MKWYESIIHIYIYIWVFINRDLSGTPRSLPKVSRSQSPSFIKGTCVQVAASDRHRLSHSFFPNELGCVALNYINIIMKGNIKRWFVGMFIYLFYFFKNGFGKCKSLNKLYMSEKIYTHVEKYIEISENV